MALASRIGNMLKQARCKQINIDLSLSSLSLYQAVRCISSSKLFVGGLSYNMDERTLKGAFAQYGEVIEARVIVNRESSRSRGFGFVSFASAEEASSAKQAMDGQELEGRSLRVDFATYRARAGRGAGSLYVGGSFGGGYGRGGGNGGGGGGGGWQ